MINNRREFLKLGAAWAAAPVLFPKDGNPAVSVAPVQDLTAPMSVEKYEKWLWIELIGFDNTKPDYGVGRFLENTGFVPEAISFLMFTADFVHTHAGMSAEWTFPPEFCSYGARPTSLERDRQAWTNYQLRGLNRELRKHNVKTYCSFFDMFINEKGVGRWAYQYPEIRETSKDGVAYQIINPLKKIKGQGLYEDFFLGKLKEVMLDYEFDGFHGADGYSSGRRPLDDIDYSDDMVGQFVSHTRVSLPGDISGALDLNKEVYAKRSRWIWKNKREEWIRFHVDRWEMFWKKSVEMLHGIQKKVVFNTAWTRAPFEAIYRYGIDYSRIAKAGIDGFVVEAAASAVAMEPELNDDYTKFHYNAMAMLMLIKAQAPDTPLRPFTGIHDTLEQYDALRHVPTVVEREIYSMANLYLQKSDGSLARCSSGPLGCLSDSVASHEWKWLKQRWDLGFSDTPQSIIGATLVWSDQALDEQLRDYIKTRRYSTHKLLYELMAAGAPVNAVVNVSDIGKTKGPLLVLNPHLFPATELEKVFAYKNGPLITIGGQVNTGGVPAASFGDVYGPSALACSVYGAKRTLELMPLQKEGEEKIEQEPADPFSWTESLYYRKVSRSFLKNCANVIMAYAGFPKVTVKEDVIRVFAYQMDKNRSRLLIGSDSFYYTTPSIDVGRTIEKIQVKTSFPGVPVRFENTAFRVRIPGKGMVILDVTTK